MKSSASEHARASRRIGAAWQRVASSSSRRFSLPLSEALGTRPHQQLTWVAMASMPLLVPVAIPGMATLVGSTTVVVAAGLALSRSARLPAAIGRRRLPEATAALLSRVLHSITGLLSRFSRPRWLVFSSRRLRVPNALFLAVAGAAMATPVPFISFDNVLPALAIVLLALGLRIRDGAMIIAGWVATVAALGSVLLFWWGGAKLALWLLGTIAD